MSKIEMINATFQVSFYECYLKNIAGVAYLSGCYVDPYKRYAGPKVSFSVDVGSTDAEVLKKASILNPWFKKFLDIPVKKS